MNDQPTRPALIVCTPENRVCGKRPYCEDENEGGFYCTRPKDHEGPHIACGSIHNYGVWPNPQPKHQGGDTSTDEEMPVFSKGGDEPCPSTSQLTTPESNGAEGVPSSPAPTPAVARVFSKQFAPCDWTEDFSHDNGNYENRCVDCGIHFLGHKRRVVCRVCAHEPSPLPTERPEDGTPTPETDAEFLRTQVADLTAQLERSESRVVDMLGRINKLKEDLDKERLKKRPFSPELADKTIAGQVTEINRLHEVIAKDQADLSTLRTEHKSTVAEPARVREELLRIADDYHPPTVEDAPLALAEMRVAVLDAARTPAATGHETGGEG